MGWNKTTDVLPTDGDTVLVYFGPPHGDCYFEVAIFNLGGRFGTIWQDANGNMQEFDVDPSHWMRLPEQPKE